MPIAPSVNALRPTRTRILLALLVLAATVALPYLVPVQRSVSHSWVAGFNNRASVLIFAAGCLFFAIYTRGRLSATDNSTAERDSTLPLSSLLIACAMTLVICTALCWPLFSRLPGYESIYFLNRLQMLNTGLHPYRDFEFAYGPLLLYPILWTERLLHLDTTRAFDLIWTLFWLFGIALLWFIIRSIDLPIRSRRLVFFLIFGVQIGIIVIAAPSYSAVRTYSAAVTVTVVHLVWKRSRNLWTTALASIPAVALALGCSMEQGVGALGGCATMLCLLAMRNPLRLFPPVLVAVLGWAACFKAAFSIGMLETLRAFGSGGYSDPVLPSPTILTTLFTYMACACAAYGAWRTWMRHCRNPTAVPSLVLPLTIAGLALLPSAMGRCDLLHIPSATPALVIGVASICTQPAVRRWWLPAFVLTVVLMPPSLFWTSTHVYLGPKVNSDPALQAQGFTFPVSDSQWYVSEPRIAVAQLPCDRLYFSPAFIPDPQKPFNPRCLDTGYYDGFTNLATTYGIDLEIRQLEQHRSDPLIMQDDPLEAQLPLQFVDMSMLRLSELSPWYPPARHPPLTYAPILAYIRAHWKLGPHIAGTDLQIWDPKP